MKPLVTSITQNFNQAHFLEERIESIIAQSYPNLEIILIDDGSTDNSFEIMKSYENHPRVSQVWKSDKNSGSAFGHWIEAIRKAKGEWIWMAESDDIADKEFLSVLLKQENNGDIIRYSKSHVIDDKGNPTTWNSCREMPSPSHYPQFENSFRMPGDEFIRKWMLNVNFIPNASATIFKKSLLDLNVDLKNLEKLKLIGDWLFWIRLLKKGDVYFEKTPLNMFRFHEQTNRSKHLFSTTLEFPYILKEFSGKSSAKKKLVNTYLYRYYSGGYIDKLNYFDHVRVFSECFKAGYLELYLKTLFNYLKSGENCYST